MLGSRLSQKWQMLKRFQVNHKNKITVVSECIVFKTARTNVIGPVIYRIAHLSPLRGFTKIENQVSAHACTHRK